MLKKIADIALNTFGWKTSRKLIVFTSDDWGSVRVESPEYRTALISGGFNMDGNRFNRFDMLESNDDLSQLFAELRKHTDQKGNHPVFTAMTNVANPNFAKIKESKFQEFFYEPFSETLKRYPAHDQVMDLYAEGIQSKIFVPEFHGREHVNVKRWMHVLQSDEKARLAFESKFYAVDRSDLQSQVQGLGAAFDIDYKDDIIDQQKIVEDGLRLFEKLFGYRATLFTAPSLQYSTALEQALNREGIRMIDVPKLQKMPLGHNKYKTRINYMGKKNALNQTYITRNAVFEPNLSPDNNTVTSCIHDIAAAFASRKPAIISNHRAAFMGGLDPNNRTQGLAALNQLLNEILHKWPDAEFVSAAELYSIMNEK